MNGRTPTKEESEWMECVIDLGCIVCLNMGIYTPAEIHHLDGSRKPGAHLKTIGLCYYHHRSGNDCEAYTSRHPYKKRFIERYGTEQYLLAKTQELINAA